MTELLAVATPQAWYEAAAGRLDELLLDHANCEKKAASTALALMFAYPEDHHACTVLAKLAREELRHFEQVDRLRRSQGLPFRRLQPGRYADGLRRALPSQEPERRIELFLLGAFIEARSCERFRGLHRVLPAPIAGLYEQLEAAEARHTGIYWQLAERAAQASGRQSHLQKKIAAIAAVEADLVTSPDAQFRFHSGVPV